MSQLPPDDWDDFARKRDLQELEARIDLRFDRMVARFEATLQQALREQTNRFFVGMGGFLAIITTVQAVLAR